MMFPEKVAVIPGGTGALGSVLVHNFLREGARVAVPTRSGPSTAAGLAQAAAETLLVAPCDVTQEPDVAAFMRAIHARWGRIDFLVHAAGGYTGGRRAEETPVADWDAMMATNLRSAFLCARAVLPGMRSNDFGRLVFVSAATALRPPALHSAYAVAKGGILTLVEVLGHETRGSGITVNAVAPSIIDTKANAAAMPEADRSSWVAPDAIWSTIRFLCSDEGAAINGTTIRFPGGHR